MNKGNQPQDGPTATVVGTIANGLPPLPVGIDSGFEGLTRIFLQRIVVLLTPVPT